MRPRARRRRTLGFDGRLAVHGPFSLDLFFRLARLDLYPVDERAVIVGGSGDLLGASPAVVDDKLQLVRAWREAEDGVEVVRAT